MGDLTSARLREILTYDRGSGVFTRRISTSSTGRAGASAGSISDAGYVQISVDGRRYYAHRLAWLYETGEWPPQELDHINGCRSDNRFENIRGASSTQNKQNRRLQKTSTTGMKGVHRHRHKFQALIRCGGKRVHLGIFETAEAAHEAYVAAANDNFGEFARAA